MNDKQIIIREPFSEPYTIDIESEVNGVDIFMTSKVQLRYDFNVLKTETDKIEIRLVQLGNTILEANNTLIKEVAQVSHVFGRMYNELHLILDATGKVAQVLNADFILSKWKQTKAELEKVVSGNADLKNAIALNDAIFTNPDKVKMAIQANEFFQVYFGRVFGTNLPAIKSITGTNIFNTANLEWKMSIDTSVSLSTDVNRVTVTSKASPMFPLTLGFYNVAYHQFSGKINLSSLSTKLQQQEIRTIAYKTGKVLEAHITKSEIAHEKKLYNKMKYTMMSDSEAKTKPKEPEKKQSFLAKEEKDTKSRFLID